MAESLLFVKFRNGWINSNVACQNVYHGNNKRLKRGLRHFSGGKDVVGWNVILHPQGGVDKPAKTRLGNSSANMARVIYFGQIWFCKAYNCMAKEVSCLQGTEYFSCIVN